MNYYKLVIADDEPMIRRGLVNGIPWEDMGFHVVADFMDGQDVMKYLEQNEVNVVFTDIQMCQISGLAVTRWIVENKPDIKVVILSGYKEFEYLKEAIELKVSDYLLKPINPVELKKVFLKIRTELDQEQRNGQKVRDRVRPYRI